MDASFRPVTMEAMNALLDYSCTITASGDASFYEDVAVPFAGDIEQVVPPCRDVPESLRIRGEPRNDFVSVVLLGLTIYVASHLSKKALDDFYTIIIQPRLKPLLEKFDAK